jgi:hypothetical protein
MHAGQIFPPEIFRTESLPVYGTTLKIVADNIFNAGHWRLTLQDGWIQITTRISENLPEWAF